MRYGWAMRSFHMLVAFILTMFVVACGTPDPASGVDITPTLGTQLAGTLEAQPTRTSTPTATRSSILPPTIDSAAREAPPSPTPGRTPIAPSPTPISNGQAIPGGGSQDTGFAGCTGTGSVEFAQSPMRMEDVAHLLPYGMLAGAHVTPIDHMYFSPADWTLGRDVYEVRAIQDGVIYRMQPRDINVDTGQTRAREWRLDIAHTCTFTSYFDLLTSVDPAIEAEWAKTEGGRTGRWNGIPLKAGQLVGHVGAQTLDFGVYDYTVTLDGLLVPEHYQREPWKVHTIDPFPYFPQDVRDQLLAKMLRQVEPRAGVIGHDVDGKLVGNWFEQGTNGYAGSDPQKYWDGHLAFARDTLDPTHWKFSIGDFDGPARQFGIKGNSPNPREVSPETGLVRYELVDTILYAINEPTRQNLGPGGLRPGDDIGTRDGDQIRGAVLVQMDGPRMLRLQVFPGQTADSVAGFTSAAKLYER